LNWPDRRLARVATLIRSSLTVHLALIFIVTALIGFLYYTQTQRGTWDEVLGRGTIEVSDIGSALQELAKPGASVADIQKEPRIARAASLNPGFGFIVRKSGLAWDLNPQGAPPSLTKAMRQMEALSSISASSCAYHEIYGQIEESGLYNMVVRFCEGEMTTVLVYGIDTIPQPAADENSWGKGELWLVWNEFYYYGLGALAALIYVGVAILWVWRTLGKVETAAYDLLQDETQALIPETRIPLEFLPLIRAVNSVGRRAADSLQRQQFFLGAAAHELRTPLTIMRLRMEELPAGPIKSEFLIDLQRLSRVMNSLLEFMRVTTVDARFSDVGLTAACERAISQVNTSAQSAGVRIDLHVPPAQASETIQGIEDLVVLALTNVLQNAISHSETKDEIGVAIEAGPTIRVRDTGPGFAPSVISTIGQPFQKYPSERSGSGLGFSIVERVMTLHGGSVHVSNDPEGGAIVELRFNQGSYSLQ